MTTLYAQYAPSIQQRINRWNELYNCKRSHLFTIDCFDTTKSRPPLYTQYKHERISWALKHYEQQLERIKDIEDDWVPFLDVFTGTEIFANALGCPVHEHENNNPSARPIIFSAADVAHIKPTELFNGPLVDYFEMAEVMLDKAGKHALLRMPDLQTPFDIAAMMWDKNDFYIALLLEKQAVHDLMAIIQTLHQDFLDAWFARYGKAHIAHYPQYYMPYGVSLSADEIGVISPELFDEFCRPELISYALKYGALSIHSCADSQHQWNGILSVPNLELVNLVQPRGVLNQSYKAFAPHPQMPSLPRGEDPFQLLGNLPENVRFIFDLSAPTLDDARHLCDKMNHALSR